MRGEKGQKSGMSNSDAIQAASENHGFRPEKRSKMRRGNKRHYRELGKLGVGIAKSYLDPESVKEQRRLAGIASGKARALAAKAKRLAWREIASHIRRLNESAKRIV